MIFLRRMFVCIEKKPTFALANPKRYVAQMAESVDALVSNTSGATRAGSTPALGTWSGEEQSSPDFLFCRAQKKFSNPADETNLMRGICAYTLRILPTNPLSTVCVLCPSLIGCSMKALVTMRQASY